VDAAVDVAVVGAGLAGLTAADALARAGLSIRVVEARPFVGGRTMTLRPDDLGDRAWFDVGATWHWDDQPLVRALAADLGLTAFPQYRQGRTLVEEVADAAPKAVELPPPDPGELRFVGGAQTLCHRLADRLPAGTVTLDTTVVAIDEAPGGRAGGGVTVNLIGADGTGADLEASYVVVAVPPRLVLENIAITPAPPDELEEVMRHTPTWMARALKCVAVYEKPFWRDDGSSGAALSEVGPLREVHDACTDDASVAALWGFVSPLHTFRDLSFDDRLDVVFAHLGRLFGPTAADPLRYFERDWSGDPFTNDEVFWVPHDLLDYGHPAFAEPLLGGRLVWAGTETATSGGGHMEGAVQSGQRAARHILGATARP
jgi:monoamine oxidase